MNTPGSLTPLPIRLPSRAAFRRGGQAVVVSGAFLGAAGLILALVCLLSGAQPMIFRSGSMAPGIPAGSLGFAQTVPAADLAVGDVVTVSTDTGARVTHRIIALDRHDDVALVQLKGDANSAADRTIYPLRSAERTWFSVPVAGSVVSWLTTPLGAVALAAYLALMLTLIGGWAARRRTDRLAGAAQGSRLRGIAMPALSASTAFLTLVPAALGGFAIPTWASWTDEAAATGAVISTGTWDVAAPTTTVTNITPAANAAGWYKTNVTVSLTATDPAPSSGIAGIHYRINGGTEQTVTGANATIPVTTEGTNTIEFWAVDNASFVESPHQFQTVKLDKTAPGAPSFTSISADTGASGTDRITSAATQTLTGSAEPNSLVTIKQGSVVVGTTTANGSGVFTFATATLGAGVNTFTATATDVADNTGPAGAGWNVTLDDVVPNSVVISPGDGLWHTTGAWTVTASDALSGIASVSYKVDAGSYTTTGTSNGTAVSPAALADGTHTVLAYATDVAGKSTQSAPVTATIKVDTVKPTAVLNLAVLNGTWRTSGAANIVGSDATSGVDHIEYQLDGSGPFLSAASGAGFTIPDGTHTIAYRAVDVAGNVGTNVTQSAIKIDSVKPSTTVASSQTVNGNGWVRANTTLTFSPTDPGPASGIANVQYRTRLNGGSWSGFTTVASSPYTLSVSTEGTTEVEYFGTDVAGNVEATKSYTLKLDRTNPTVPTVTPASSTTVWRSSNQMTITAADALSGVDYVEYRLGTSGAYTQVASGTPFALPEGTNTVYYHTVDKASNANADSGTAYTVKVDTTGPAFSSPVPGDGVTNTSFANIDCAKTGTGSFSSRLCVDVTDAGSGLSGTPTFKLVRTSSNQCWNGSSFVSGTGCAAQAMTPVSGNQYRSAGNALTGMNDGTYQVTYAASDAVGNSSTLVTTFTIVTPDTTGPTVTITNPSSNQGYQQNGTPGCSTNAVWDLCGTASDPSGVDRVEFVLLHNGIFGTSDKCLGSNGSWTNSNCGTRLTASGTTSWSYVTGSLPDDGFFAYSGYVLTVYAYDQAGNVTSTSRSFDTP